MGRIAHLLEHPAQMVSRAIHPMAHHERRSRGGIAGIVILAVMVLGIAWMWPEIQRYIKIKRM